jgi:hypothetical protein
MHLARSPAKVGKVSQSQPSDMAKRLDWDANHIASKPDFQHLQLLASDGGKVLLIHFMIAVGCDFIRSMGLRNFVECFRGLEGRRHGILRVRNCGADVIKVLARVATGLLYCTQDEEEGCNGSYADGGLVLGGHRSSGIAVPTLLRCTGRSGRSNGLKVLYALCECPLTRSRWSWLGSNQGIE